MHPTPPPSRNGRVALVLGALALLVLVSAGVGLLRPGAGAPPAQAAPGAGGPPEQRAPPVRALAPRAAPDAAPALGAASAQAGARAQERALWTKRLVRAEHTLRTYREGTRYPPESAPISEHPDQVFPPEPERPFPLGDEDDPVRLTLKQDRVFVAGDEVVHFYVTCADRRGTPQRCEVGPAFAHEPPHREGARGVAPVPVAFRDDGQGDDARADDGVSTARLQPSRDGFALVEGTLRVELDVRAGSDRAHPFFDVLFTPAPPARLTGRVREAVEQGSLQLYVGLEVRRPGRYVLTGRVDDAQGKPFALVTFNEELAAGAHEARLTVFGKLVHDQRPTFPLRLRDVDGFLLREQGDPDRELLVALRGPVHVTRAYAPTSFSPEEWQSEERQRHLDEFEKDVREAEEKLAGLRDPP